MSSVWLSCRTIWCVVFCLLLFSSFFRSRVSLFFIDWLLIAAWIVIIICITPSVSSVNRWSSASGLLSPYVDSTKLIKFSWVSGSVVGSSLIILSIC
jgi:hypothetical protein